MSLHESWGSLQVYVNMRGKRGRRVDFEDSGAAGVAPAVAEGAAVS